MQRYEENGLQWLKFDLLSEISHLEHAIFLRKGGHSDGPFHSLNLSYKVGDSPDHVRRNRSLVQNKLSAATLVSPNIVHGNHILEIQSHKPPLEEACDGLMTTIPGIGILTTHADCQAAIFYDPINRAVANVHSGWRSSVLNIYQKTISAMQARYGTHPKELLVCISPSLGPDSSEFIHYQQELPPEFWNFQPKPFFFDFWAISEHQLKACGVLSHHIEIARIDTYSNPEDFFSYRRNKITGRQATCVLLTS